MNICSEKLKIIVHCGCVGNIADTIELIKHAISFSSKVNLYAIASIVPCYFKYENIDMLKNTLSTIIKACNEVSFYYYHIPMFTGITAFSMHDILTQIDQDKDLSNFKGLKFSHNDLDDYKTVVNFKDNKYDVLLGCDELYVESFSYGNNGSAVSSSLNVIKNLDNYRNMKNYVLNDKSKALVYQQNIIEFHAYSCGKSISYIKKQAGYSSKVRLPLENFI